MKKQILTIILGIFLVGCVSAMYSGECVNYDFSDKVDVLNNLTWEIVNNTYDTEGIYINQTEIGAEVCLDILFKPDNFTILFNLNGLNEVVIQTSNSGGSSGSNYKSLKTSCYPVYSCGLWGECVNGVQTRTCELLEDKCCDKEILLPTQQKCKVIESEVEEIIENENENEYEVAKNNRNKLKKVVLFALILVVLSFIIMPLIKASIQSKKKNN